MPLSDPSSDSRAEAGAAPPEGADDAPGPAPDAAPSTRDGFAPIRRLLALSLEDRGALFAIFGLGLVVAASRYVQMLLVQPLMDGVVLPSTAEDFRFETVRPLLAQIGGIAALTLVAAPLAVLGRGYAAEWVAGRVRQRIDVSMARKLLRVPLRVFRERSSGDFLARAMADAQISCQTVALFYREVVVNAQMLVVGLVVLAWISWPMTLVVGLAMPPFLFFVHRFMTRIVDVSSRRQETQGNLSDRLIAILSGIKVIKAFRGEAVEQAAYDRETDKYFRRHMKMMRAGATMKAMSETLWPIVGAVVLGIGGYAVLHDMGGLTLGSLSAFAGVLVVLFKPVRRLSQALPIAFEASGSAQRLFELLDLEEDVPDRPDARAMSGVARSIRFEDVTFDYGHRPILDGIDLEVAAGEVVAIVGRTGSGKSTLVDLLLRFHEPTRGRITIDDVDLRDLERASFLDHVALVTQEPFLFAGSLRENIRYARPDASDAQVEDAARTAAAHEFIEALPEGYDTLAGEFGLRLSGGQRQRVTIARAILADASILVFDEATSALDAGTERAVQDAIEGLRGTRTIFLVAHRLTTIERADRIVVLDEGRIVEMGDHETLLARGGAYARLIEAQTALAS